MTKKYVKFRTQELLDNYFGEEKTNKIMNECVIEDERFFYLDAFKMKKVLGHDDKEDFTELLNKVVNGNLHNLYLLFNVVKNPEVFEEPSKEAVEMEELFFAMSELKKVLPVIDEESEK
jgi:hypothetical protein